MQVMRMGRFGAITDQFSDGNAFGFGSKLDVAIAEKIEKGGDEVLVAEVVHRKSPPAGEQPIVVRVPDGLLDRKGMKMALGITAGASLVVGGVVGWLLKG